MVVPRRRQCGIADYAECLAAAFSPSVGVTWIDLAGMSSCGALRQAAGSAPTVDVALVHYEYELFGNVSPFRNGYSAFMSRLNVPAIVVMHGPFPRLAGPLPVSSARRWLLRACYLPFMPWWEARQYRRAAHTVAHAPEIAERARRFLKHSRVTLMPHPIRRGARMWTAAHGTPVRLVTPGFIKSHKGFHEGLALLAARPQWHWVLAGGAQNAQDEAYIALLTEAARGMGVIDRLHITGYLSPGEIEAVCTDATAAFFPFRSVTGSGSMTWCIGMGMPILATDLPATRQLALDGAGIGLLRASAPDSWLETVDTVTGTPEALATLSRRNQAYAASHGYEHLAERFESILHEIAGGAP